MSTFCDTVLMMSSDSTERDFLTEVSKVFSKLLRIEGVVVQTEMFETNTMFSSESVKCSLGLEGFTGPERDLVSDKDKTGIVISENGSSMISESSILLASGVSEATWSSADILIAGDRVSRVHIVATKGHLVLRFRLNPVMTSRSTVLLGEKACGAFH